MGKKKDKKAEKFKKTEKNSSASSVTEKKGLKKECCEKYLKKGEHKRCKRCPCFDMPEQERQTRFKKFDIEIPQ